MWDLSLITNQKFESVDPVQSHTYFEPFGCYPLTLDSRLQKAPLGRPMIERPKKNIMTCFVHKIFTM